MKLFIVIPVFNRISHTRKCLEAFEKQNFKDFTIILVDDGSTDGTGETVATRFPWVHRIEGNGNWWWTRSVNEGIKTALDMGATHILLINNDVWIAPNYIESLLEATNNNPFALIGSLNITMNTPHRIFSAGVKKFNPITFKETKYYQPFSEYKPSHGKIVPSSALNGRGTLVPVAVFDKIGLFDQKYMPQYGADFDFSMRAAKAGYPSLMSYDAIVYGDTEETGAGKPFMKQSLGKFLKSYLNPYSQTSYRMWATFVWRHGNKILFPFTFGLVLTKMLVSYLKNNIK